MLKFSQKTTHPTHLSLSLQFMKTKGGRSIALYGILFSLLFLCVAAYRPAFLSLLDKKLYDVMHHSLVDYGAPLPLIVDIDEKSLKS